MIGEQTVVGGRVGIVAPRHGVLGGRIRARAALPSRHGILTGFRRAVLVQLVLAMCLVAMAILLYLAMAGQTSVISYNIAELQAQRARLSTERTHLQLQVASLQSVPRIDKTAITQLHMIRPPATADVVWLSPSAPHITPSTSNTVDLLAARRQSEPLAWLRDTFNTVRSSL